MSGLQDENGFSAGGGTDGIHVAPIARPNPAAVAAAISKQIAEAKKSAAVVTKVAKTTFVDTKFNILEDAFEKIDDADESHWNAVFQAEQPVIDQQGAISDLEKRLRQAKIDLAAKRVVFSAKKGELKTAYKTALAGIKEAASTEIANAKTTREQVVQDAREALDKAIAEGSDTVEKEETLLEAYNGWQAKMKWEGRKAGFNAVAATVKAIVEAVQTTYRENRDLARANVEIPAALLKRQSDSPQAPAPT